MSATIIKRAIKTAIISLSVMQIIIGIDIGYSNLGFVKSTLTDSFEVRIDMVDLVNIRALPHHRIPRNRCTLYHTNEISDLIAHFIQEYRPILDEADVILLERQPPGGLTNIEALLFYEFRNKCVLISPNAMHAHFSIGTLDYEHRKRETTRIAQQYWNLEQFDRKHDIADAICMILYHTHKDRRRHKMKTHLPFEEFRYLPQLISEHKITDG